MDCAEASQSSANLATETSGYLNQSQESARNWGGRKTDFPEDVSTGDHKLN